MGKVLQMGSWGGRGRKQEWQKEALCGNTASTVPLPTPGPGYHCAGTWQSPNRSLGFEVTASGVSGVQFTWKGGSARHGVGTSGLWAR